MNLPTPSDLFQALDATWPPYAFHNYKGWLIREGAGGGQRVSAATLLQNTQHYEISAAEEKMDSIGKNPLFMIHSPHDNLDRKLQTKGYNIVDPVAILVSPIKNLLSHPSTNINQILRLDKPNTSAKNIWKAGGIDQARLNIMARVTVPKTILAADDMGVAFAAAYDGIAMVHAVEVAKDHRRKGVANSLMHEAIQFANDQNCQWLAVLTVRANKPANSLYEALGMVEAASYHYRVKH